ncbi:MAG: DUF393 domain-containing protein [Anaeromyxobacter sp.]|nr:DUF393 domain-containing protein [Anaeromyxobacter sp.]MBL0278541.1 DUF393 domain-containing protein [Anaeromyxobacter sp.]
MPLPAAPAPAAPALVLYDGACGLCRGAVAWLLAHDPAGRLRFAPLGGETARSLAAGRPGLEADADSVVLIAGGRTWLRSRAVLRALGHLPAPWRWAAPLARLPAWLLDPPYRLVARRRRLLRRAAPACALPDPDHATRFLP